MRKFLHQVTKREYVTILFLFVLIISVGVIANSVSDIRDNRPRAATMVGPNSPSAAVVIPDTLYSASSGANNVLTSNNVRSSCQFFNPSNQCQWIRTTGYGFTIPSNATIQGIQVDLEAYFSTALNSPEMVVQMLRGSKIVQQRLTGKNKTTESYLTLGGPADTWGGQFTVADINAGDFGVQVRAYNLGGSGSLYFYIDHVQMTVYYTAPPPPPPPPPTEVCGDKIDNDGDGQVDEGCSSGGSSSGGSSSGSGISSGGTAGGGTLGGRISGLPALPPASGTKTDPNNVSLLKVSLSVPYLLGTLPVPLIIGNYVQELGVSPEKKNYEVEVGGAKFKLGSQIKIESGGGYNLLIKKLALKAKAPNQPLKLGNLILGDVTNDNVINEKDKESFIVLPADINADGVSNSLDWAVLLANFGKRGD